MVSTSHGGGQPDATPQDVAVILRSIAAAVTMHPADAETIKNKVAAAGLPAPAEGMSIEQALAYYGDAIGQIRPVAEDPEVKQAARHLITHAAQQLQEHHHHLAGRMTDDDWQIVKLIIICIIVC